MNIWAAQLTCGRRHVGEKRDDRYASDIRLKLGNEVRKGLQAHLEKRKPEFDRRSPI